MENNCEPKTYAGFTIGPIYEVLGSARKTRELWFGSYFFSWFMEKLIEEILESDNKNIHFLSPYIKKPFGLNKSPTGKYHDRFILCSSLDKEKLFEIIEKASDNTINYFAEIIDDLVKNRQNEEIKRNYLTPDGKDKVKEFLSWYIQRNFVVVDIDKDELNIGDTVKKPFAFVNSLLDSMEENRTFKTGVNESTCYVCKVLPAAIKAYIYTKEKEEPEEEPLCPMCFLKHFALFSDEVKKKIGKTNFKFPSTLEISAKELLTEKVRNELKNQTDNFEKDFEYKDIENTYKEVYGDSKEIKKYLKKDYFKYFAILQADGDNLGETLKQLNENKIEELSQKLLDFSEEAERIIKDYEGYPIYIGGDDILALTPVAVNMEDGNFKNVFNLAKELHNKYSEVLCGYGTTLSIGINIVYYKFPLSIALRDARNELFGVAKQKCEKNALAITYTVHSGDKHEIAFKFDDKDKENNEITLFGRLISDVLSDTIKIPQGLFYNLSRFSELLSYITDEKSLSNFFENNFNEPEHLEKYKQGLDRVKEYLEKVMLPCINFDKQGCGDKLSDNSGTSDEKSPYEKRIACMEEVLEKIKFIKFLYGEE
ncbi:MAG: type III-B CRISPR-associated protein Cas10/Cmr2 [Caldisericum sp.]|jgi:CRISPR-associated protein Cmr2|nr:type III-B CRISPR-associated protein Cas10/Cmr2 [Caldisericum sp.]